MAKHKTFISKIKIGNNYECWPWLASTDRHGYGQLCINGKNNRAHRIAFELFNGKISEGMCVLHTCDNPGCCNPKHLIIGTKADNTKDMMNKHRNKCGRLKGESNPFAKLTETQVKIMRRLFATGFYTKRSLAIQFNITEANTGYILNRKAWKHV